MPTVLPTIACNNAVQSDNVCHYTAVVSPGEGAYAYIHKDGTLLLLLLKKIGNARPGEGDCLPLSLNTPAPHYHPIEEKKRKGK